MPIPVSQTSIRRVWPRARQPTRIFATVGIADGVGHQILNNPLQQRRVGADDGGRWPNPERQPPVTGERSELGPDTVEQCREREVRQPGLHDAGVEPGNIEQTVEQDVDTVQGCL